jgi:uncharacterized membrane protein YfcA
MNHFFVILCLLFAGFIHGFTGFGYAMTAMALLPLLLGMPEALFIGAFFTLPVSAWLLWKFRDHYRWRDAWPLIVGAVAGTPMGLLLVEHINRMLLLHSLGIVLIVFPLADVVGLSRYVQPPDWTALPIGIICGILGAAFNVSGPVAILYIYSRPWSREQMVATLQMLFLFNSGLRVLLTLPTGVVTPELALLCAAALLPFLGVAMLGSRLAERVPHHRFRQVVLAAVMVMGVKYTLT